MLTKLFLLLISLYDDIFDFVLEKGSHLLVNLSVKNVYLSFYFVVHEVAKFLT